MSLERRDFLKYVSLGAVATTLKPSFGEVQEQAQVNVQKIHPDFRTNNPGLEYYLIGNGLITAAIQTSPTPESGTHCGLLLMQPDHFARKMSTYLFHPERGLQNTRMIVVIDGKSYTPEFATSTVRTEYPDHIPTIVLEWEAGECRVREELMCPSEDSALVRTVTVENKTAGPISPTGIIMLYPNLMLFDEYAVDRERGTLSTTGYETMEMFCLNDATPGDRHLNIKFGAIAAGRKKSSVIVLTVNLARKSFEKKGLPKMIGETKKYWSQRGTIRTNH